MEEFLGPQAQYNEEEEERKYYRRKRLGVIKNVVAGSFGAMMVYSIYMGAFKSEERRLKVLPVYTVLLLLLFQVCCRCS